jgi:hypothetical protein
MKLENAGLESDKIVHSWWKVRKLVFQTQEQFESLKKVGDRVAWEKSAAEAA